MKKNQKGFTLIELMVVIGIASMMGYVIYTALRTGHEQINATDARITIEDASRHALYSMIQEIRQSGPTRMLIENGGASLLFLIPNPNNPTDANFRVNWAAGHTIAYAVLNRQLIRTNQTTNQTRVLANDVVSVNFTGNNVNPTLVTVTINAQRTLVSGKLVPLTPLQSIGQAEVRNL